jgi:hypothetical protein
VTGELKWLPAQITMPFNSTYDTTTGIGSWMQSKLTAVPGDTNAIPVLDR